MDYPRLLKVLRWPVAFLLLTCMATASWGQVQPGWAEERARLKMTLEDMGPEALARGADATDRAVAMMNLAQMSIYTYNMGIQLGRVFSSGRANFPNPDGTERSYWFTSSVVFAVEDGPWHPTPMAHETSDFHSMTKMDWEAKDGARGIQFSNPPVLRSGYPVYALSDLPDTWPTAGWPAPESIVEVWAGTDTWNKWERVGDRNSYCVFDDSYADREGDGQSIPLGIEVKKRAIAYGAMNLVFIQYEFTNTSSNNYTGVFVGHICDKGSPTTGDFEDAWLEYEEEHQIIYSKATNYSAATETHTRPGRTEQAAFVGQMVLESPTGSFREDNYDPDNRGINYLTAAVNPMPIEDGTITFGPDNILTRVALIDWGDRVLVDETSLYGAFSGDISVMESGYADNIWKVGQSGTGTPIYKQTSVEYEAYNGSLADVDHFYYTASGPFSMAAGASFDFVVAFVGGLTYGQMIDRAVQAKHVYNVQFAGPSAPPAPGNFQANGIQAGPGGREYDPRIHAYPIYYAPSGNITLTWDLSATVTTADPSSAVLDAEGIRLFRSMDRGNTWGPVITDTRGAFAAWVPYRQWDLDDGVTGDDGLSYTYLGDDTGLVSSFTDEDALDGVEYWYAIAAYDQGEFDPGTGAQTLRSLQSPMGNNPGSPTVIAVVAGSRPNGYMVGEPSITGAERLYTDIPYNSDATVSVNMVNDGQIQTANYRVTTTLDPDYGDLSYTDVFGVTLQNLTTGETLFTNLAPELEDYGSGLLPVTEGIQLVVDTDWNADPDPWNQIDYDLGTNVTEYSGYGMNYADWRFQGSTLDYTDLATLQTDFFPVEIHWSATTTQVGYTWTRSGYAYRGTGTFPGTAWDVSDPSSPRQINLAWTVQSTRPAGDNNYNVTSPADQGTYRSYLLILSSDYDAGASAFYPTVTYTSGQLDALYESWLGVDAAYLTSGQTLGQYLEGQMNEYYFRRPMSAGTTFEFSTTASAIQDSLIDLDDIKVVPNPYYIYADWDMSVNRRKIQFTNVPMNSQISIYTLSGELVAILDHHGDATAVAGGRQYNSNRVGTVDWNIWTYEFTEAAYGLYVYVVKTDDGKTKVGKFAVIR